MRIAVLGTGFAGLSVAWHALEKGMKVTLFDPNGLGGGASGAATGLLHPFPGKTASRSYRADEGMAEANRLLEIAEKELGKPVAARSGIFRPAITEEQRAHFKKAIGPDATWRKIDSLEGLWIEKGITVFPRLYLKGLLMACEKKGGVLIEKAPELSQLEKEFDRIVLCVGAQILQYDFVQEWSLRTAIGQSLLCKWGTTLPFGYASQGHISVTEDPHLCQVGATYEHTKEPSPEKAKGLLEKVAKFYPPARRFEIVKILSGTRVAPRNGHEPIITQIGPKTWVFTGLGSRGLLYHALYGQTLISAFHASSIS